jgi:hypothetical protein
LLPSFTEISVESASFTPPPTLLLRKPLIETNPYLRDPAKYRKTLITNLASPTAIETGASVDSIARMLVTKKATKTKKRR